MFFEGSPPTSGITRDQNGIAILDPAVWVFDSAKTCFINRKTLEFLPFYEAVQPNSSRHGGGFRRRSPSPTRQAAAPATASPGLPPSLLPATPPIGQLDVFGRPCLGYGVYKFAVPGPKLSFWESVAKDAEVKEVPFDRMGTHTMLASSVGHALEARVSEALRAVHPGVAGVRCTSSFVINYAVGSNKQLGHEPHADRSDLTLNLCLGRDFDGGELVFAEPALPKPAALPRAEVEVEEEEEPLEPTRWSPQPLRPSHIAPVSVAGTGATGTKKTVNEGEVRVPHTVGEAVLHLGCLNHATEPITRGQRVNLICFFAVDWAPFPFLDLPKDLQRLLVSYLPARDVMALSATGRAVHHLLEAHEPLWERLLSEHALYATVKTEAAELRREGVSARRVFVAALELATIQGLSRTLSQNAPQIICKETYEMGLERSAREAQESEATVCRLGLHKDMEILTKGQRFRTRGVPAFVPPGYLPSAGFSRWLSRMGSRDQLAPVEAAPKVHRKMPGPLFQPLMQQPKRVERVTLASLVRGTIKSAPKPEWLDTDGTNLEQFPWFTPISGNNVSYPFVAGWYVQPWGEDFILCESSSSRRSSISIEVKNNGVAAEGHTYRSVHAFVDAWTKKHKIPCLRFPTHPVKH